MTDEEKTVSDQKKNTSTASTTKTNDTKGTPQSIVGGVGGSGVSDQNEATVVCNGEVVVNDPMVNIGCKQPGGIIINIPPRAKFRLTFGFSRFNLSIWEMIEASGQYKELIEAGTIYLSKNGC